MGVENFTSITEVVLLGLSGHRKTQILLFAVILITYSFTVLGNLAVILLVRSDSRLHTPMYFFLSHFSFLELCYVTSTLPQTLAQLLTDNGVISFTHCGIQAYIITVLGGTECFLLSVMAYDRYLAICRPLLYVIAMSRWRQWQLALSCWGICFFIAAINVSLVFRHPFCGFNHFNHFFCELPLVVTFACGDTVITKAVLFWLSALVILVPFCIVLTSYGLILLSVLQMRSASGGLRKALSTCASHLVVVTLFYGTLTFMYLKPQSGAAQDRNKKIAVFYIVVTPLLNPIIYTLRNKDIHASVAKLLVIRGSVQIH